MQKIAIMILLLMLLTGCNLFRNDQTVIYDIDDRQDIYQVKNNEVLPNSMATTSLWRFTDVLHKGTYYKLNTQEFGYKYMLKPGTRFYNQPIGAFCSGVLVAPDIIATAGHCIKEPLAVYGSPVFVFGYQMDGPRTPVTMVNKVYIAEKIIARKLLKTGEDFCLIKLKEPVKYIRPVTLSTDQVKKGDKLYMLGHPTGLPQKYTPNGIVNNVDGFTYTVTLDAFGGNSGSPVFNKKHELVGLLVRGAQDFIWEGSYRIENRVRSNNWNGEGVVSIDLFKDYIK